MSPKPYCPNGECDHAFMLHDWEEPEVRAMCCVEGCLCGKRDKSSKRAQRHAVAVRAMMEQQWEDAWNKCDWCDEAAAGGAS